MKRNVLTAVGAIALWGVACMSVDDTPGVTVGTSPADADAGSGTGAEGDTSPRPRKDGGTTTSPAANDDAGSSTPEDTCPPLQQSGSTYEGCCLPTGRCGYFIAALNACVDAVQIGAPESTTTCTYTGNGDGDDDDDDKDKDKDKDDDDKDDDD